MDKSKLNDPREWRKFGIGTGLILAAAFAVRTFAFHRPSPVLAAIGLLFPAFGLLWPIVLKPVHTAFTYFGFVMGWFMTRVILTVLFYGILTPIALVSKCFGQKHLHSSFDRKPATYWLPREHPRDLKTGYEEQS